LYPRSMTIERAFRLVHHLDIPESKRRYWPQFSSVVVSGDDSVSDVFLFFESPTEQQQFAALKMYRGCMLFSVTAGTIHTTLEGFRKKVLSTAAFIRKHVRQPE
jgi:hypothetical protein